MKKDFKNNLKFIFETETFKWVYLNNEKTKYLVSSKGFIYTTNYLGKTGKFIKLKSRKQYNGYVLIILHHNGKAYPKLLHRIVANAFIPNPDNLFSVNHIDGNKENNDVYNLEWCSSKDNSIHAANTGLIATGEKSILSKINNETAENICKEIESNTLSIKDLSLKYNTTYNTVYDIYRRRSWKQVSCKYNFANYNQDKRYTYNKKITKVQRLSKA